MQEIIKGIISIDKKAIQKEQECREYLENLDNHRQSRVSELKVRYESRLNQEILDKKNRLDAEIESESLRIIDEARKQRDSVEERFKKFEERVSEDAFRMILRNLED